MLRIYVDGDSMTERHRSIILRRVIGNADAFCVFAADRVLPDVIKAIEKDRSRRMQKTSLSVIQLRFTSESLKVPQKEFRFSKVS